MRRRACAGWLGVLVAVSAVAAARGESPSPGQVDAAAGRAVAFLRKQLHPELGRCVHEYDGNNVRFGGRTGLIAYTLASAGQDPRKDARLQAALHWLRGAKLTGTYAVATRAMALSGVRPTPQRFTAMQADAKWLVNAAGSDGRYTYTPIGKTSRIYDNSNAQFAALALDALARRGVEVPPAYWQTARRWWRSQQQVDGGWGYRIPRGMMRVRSYGSMSAAGLATLLTCDARVASDDVVRCRASRAGEPLRDAMGWLAKNYTVRRNPGKGVEWYYYWLFSLQRVGLTSGRKLLGGHDWQGDGTRELLRRQRSDGSWGLGNRIEETCFALLFLAKGRRPVVVNKLEFTGRWNTRPRDAANLTDWLSRTFETPMNWQIVSLDANDVDWRSAPVLYLSGAGPLALGDKDIARLRRYALRGGLILSEAACNNGDFTLDMQKFYKRMFPELPLRRIEADSLLRTIQYKRPEFNGLLVHNGVRPLAVHCPEQISLDLHLSREEKGARSFEIAANVLLAATDRSPADAPQTRPWPAPTALEKPRATLRVATVKHAANWNPEPLAMQRLARELATSHQIALKITPGVTIEKLTPARHPIAVMTGTGALQLSAARKAAMKKYITTGGTLVIDAAGGDEAFAQSVRKEILPLLPSAWQSTLTLEHDVYAKGPAPIKRVRYRPATARARGEEADRPAVIGVETGGRVAIFFSPHDWTAAMLGAGSAGIDGYAPASARAILTNILHYAAQAEIASATIEE